MSMRHALRYAADLAACLSGHLGRRERREAAGFTALMYHRVLPDAEYGDYPKPALAVPLTAFRRQVEWLARRADVRTVAEALRLHPDGKATARAVVCLTFDDGYLDNHEIVAPVLEAAGVRGSFYVTADAVERGSLLWFDEAHLAFAARGRDRVEAVLGDVTKAPVSIGGPGRFSRELGRFGSEARQAVLGELRPADGYEGEKRFRLMRPEHVEDLHAHGHEIGSHTLTHPRLTVLGDDELRRELRESRDRVSKWTGAPVPGFCYPQGDHDHRVAEAVRESGYEYALTTNEGANSGRDDVFLLARRGIKNTRTVGWNGRASVLAFRCEMNGFHGWLARREAGRSTTGLSE